MRLKLNCVLPSKAIFPYNYNYELQNVIYRLIEKSSSEFSESLHDTGFVDDGRPFKLFTFSKAFFHNAVTDKEGFSAVTSFDILFSTPIRRSYEHLVTGIFAKQEFTLYFSDNHSIDILIMSVESLPEPDFSERMNFITLSPLVASTNIDRGERLIQHYLDYTYPDEKERYVTNIYHNLVRKYQLVHKKKYSGDNNFDFSFDTDYIRKKQGRIRKNIRFKRNDKTGKYSRIIGMEAPFIIKTDPELIKVGYQCGFGEKNSAGFGMAEIVC